MLVTKFSASRRFRRPHAAGGATDIASSDNLRITLLPAQHGDALLLAWGPDDAPHFLLVDGGPSGAYTAVSEGLMDVRNHDGLDLLVLSHIDSDHIEGLLLLCNDPVLDLPVREVWFNGSGQLDDDLGVLQGEMLTALVTARGLPLNARFGHHAVKARTPFDVEDFDGLRLTVLAPEQTTLSALRDSWAQALTDADLEFGHVTVEQALELLRGRKSLIPRGAQWLGDEDFDIHDHAVTPSPKDYSLTNRSSIVLLVEYGRASVLLTGDATPTALLPAVRRLRTERPDLEWPLSAVKLPHHGSAANVTAELVALLPARHYLVSSDGSRFGHPDDVAIARVVEHGPPGLELVFNYRTDQTRTWERRLARAPGYTASTRYPPEDGGGVMITLSSATGLAS